MVKAFDPITLSRDDTVWNLGVPQQRTKSNHLGVNPLSVSVFGGDFGSFPHHNQNIIMSSLPLRRGVSTAVTSVYCVWIQLRVVTCHNNKLLVECGL